MINAAPTWYEMFLHQAATGSFARSHECHLCRREAPCECMTLVQDGGPSFEPITGTWGWSYRPWRCMCTCGGCQADDV